MKILAKKLLAQKREKALEMIGKKIEVQVSRKAISIDSEKKTAIFVMSTSNIDRHGDMIDQKSWILKYFLENPAFFLQHRSNEFPIGKWLRVWFEADPENPGQDIMLGEAQFRTEFEDADRAFRHVEEGDLNMVSVGFIPHRVEYDEVRDCFVLYDCELMECSLVGIGSNRQALVKGKETEEKPESLKEVKETIIEARDSLDNKIKSSENVRVMNNLKALELLNKAIRQIR